MFKSKYRSFRPAFTSAFQAAYRSMFRESGAGAVSIADLAPALWLKASDGATTGGSRKFTAGDKARFEIASNSSLQAGNINFMLGCWFYISSTAGDYQYLISKEGGLADTEFILRVNGTGTSIEFFIGGTAYISTDISTLQVGKWYFVLAWHDADLDTVNLQINNGTVSSATTNGNAPIGNDTAVVRIGGYVDGLRVLNGRISGAFFTKEILTSAERTWLYNDHHPRSYSELGEAGTDGANLLTNLVSFWPCNETSASAGLLDAHGSNDLTFTNTELLSNPGFETAGADGSFGAEKLVNRGFETYVGTQDDGTSDTFTSWTIFNTDGKHEATATVNSGTSALKLTGGATSNGNYIYQNVAVSPSTAYRWQFYTRGDGTNSGRTRIFNVSVGNDIQSITSVAVPGTTYTLVTINFTTPATCSNVRLMFYPPESPTGVAYFDDVSFKTLDVYGSWIELITGNSTVNDETVNVDAGSHACRFDVDSSNSSVQVYQNILTVGNTYNVSVKARGSATINDGFKAILGTTEAINVSVANPLTTAYQLFTGSGTAAGSTSFFLSRDSSPSQSVYLDTVSVKAAGIPAANGPAVATASDSIGTNHGTLVGFSDAQQITAWTADGLTFDGVNNIVSIPGSVSDTPLTFTAWIKPTTVSGTIVLFEGANDDWQVGIFNGSLFFGKRNVSSASHSGIISADVWTFIAITYDGTTVKLYYNTDSSHNEAYTQTFVPSNKTFGRVGFNFSGKIHNSRTYNAVLSDSQVAQLAAGNEATGATPVAQWEFNDGPQLGGIADGDAVVAITSKDANRYVLSQPTAAKRFTFVANGINGKNAFQADGVDDFMQLAINLSGATGLSIYAVMKSSDDGGDNVLMEYTTDAVTSGAGGFLVNPRVLNNVPNAWVSGDASGSSGIFSPVDLTDGITKLVELHSNLNNQHFMVIDGAQGTVRTESLSGGLTNSILYLCMRAGTSLPFAGLWDEIIIFDEFHDEETREIVREILTAEYLS